ncbi:ornithine carbamoyltransferase [Streptomyces griseorubiginosus]|uniref:ornithine carbamoyltransferase n=1 Tax=Streptomyces griseorubiginosus TaxID=67304 RepID=UPI00363C9265
MTVDLRGRSYLNELDFTGREIHHLLELAARLKGDRCAGTEKPRLTGRHLALLFDKASTRTRCAFVRAAADQGAATTFLGHGDTHIGVKESVADTARVLGRMFDAIAYRGSAHTLVTDLADHAGVPVYNGLTDAAHPTRSLCDVFTMREHSRKPLTDIAYCYLGDARNNMGNSLLAMGALLGMDVRIAAPSRLWPDPVLVADCRARAEGSGARITLTDDVETAVRGADFLYTDAWVSMGEHALPACSPRLRHRRGRDVLHNYGLDALEVTDAVFSSPASIVFDQAENRLHTVKAVLVATLED